MTVMMVHQLNVETLTKCSEAADMEAEEDLEVAAVVADMEEEVVEEDMEAGEVMEEGVEVDLEVGVAVDLEEEEDITMEEDLEEVVAVDLEEEEGVVMDQIQDLVEVADSEAEAEVDSVEDIKSMLCNYYLLPYTKYFNELEMNLNKESLLYHKK